MFSYYKWLWIFAITIAIGMLPQSTKFFFCLPYLLPKWFKDEREAPLHFYGIKAFVGDVGSGKTMSMVYYLDKMRRKYGDSILITTNFGYKDEDFSFSNFEDLLTLRDKPLIVGWDEIQNEYCSRDFSKFPITLLTLLTQNRKKNGVQILYSCQHLSHIDKIFRDMTNEINFCYTWLGRYTFFLSSRPNDLDGTERRKFRLFPKWTGFCQTERLRGKYDSYQILKSATNRGYGDYDGSKLIDNVNNAPKTKAEKKEELKTLRGSLLL